jgi:superfamily II DNA or RNA helicase
MLRLHLPPNLVAAAARDAVPVRVELDLTSAPPPDLLPALALLQRWCGATPPAFLQLTRAQLREFAAAAGELPIFVEQNRPGPWRHAALVTEVPAPTAATPGAPPPATSRRPPSAPPGPPPLILDGSEHYLALTLPSREHPRHAAALALVKENGFVLEPSNRRWWLRDRHKTLLFLARHLRALREEWGAELTPGFRERTAHLVSAGVAAEVTEAAEGFEVTVGLRAAGADDAALRTALATNRGYVEAGGRIILLDTAVVARLAAAQRALAGDPATAAAPRRTQRLPAARVAEAHDVLAELAPDFQPPETWRRRSDALRHLTSLPAAPVPAALDRQLRPYQRLGTAWLWHLHQHQLGGILADEMGLGKTLQALALLSALRAADAGPGAQAGPPATALARTSAAPSPLLPRGVSLVVCPASLLENWRREAARFAPHLRVFVHHGDSRLGRPEAAAAHDLIITSYGTLARDQALFAAVAFAVIVADEAQHLKNRRSQNAAALRALRAGSRFLLTGTPLENSLDDLRSLFEVLLPGYLPRVPAGLRGDERTWYDERLRAQTAPYLLRRTKRGVAPELPAKLEQILWCELTPAQAALYRATQERSEREFLDLAAGGASEAQLKFAALTQLLRLRQICCDPRLLPPAAAGTRPAAGEADPAPTDSAKLDAFQELLAEAIDDGHRVLVFSQFTSLLALLRPELAAQGIAHCYLDGAMPTRARQAEVDRFQSDPDIPVFLLSLKAGGTGLNLTAADTVVHLDPWWNPAAEAQATDRAHRIGQTRVVTSYKLITTGTVEEKVLALQAEKRALLAGVFEASDALSARLSLADLKDLLAR